MDFLFSMVISELLILGCKRLSNPVSIATTIILLLSLSFVHLIPSALIPLRLATISHDTSTPHAEK